MSNGVDPQQDDHQPFYRSGKVWLQGWSLPCTSSPSSLLASTSFPVRSAEGG